MPSPAGTNRQQLFMGVLRSGPAAVAGDAAPRRHATDATPQSIKAMSAMEAFWDEVLSPNDRGRAETLLEAVLQAQSADESASADPDDADETDNPDDDQAQDKRRRGMSGDRRSGYPTPEQIAGGEMGLAKPLPRGRAWVGDRATYLRVNDQMSRRFPHAKLPKQY
jgi:hypothetical protein